MGEKTNTAVACLEALLETFVADSKLYGCQEDAYWHGRVAGAEECIDALKQVVQKQGEPLRVPKKLPINGLYDRHHTYACGWNDAIDAMAAPKTGEQL